MIVSRIEMGTKEGCVAIKDNMDTLVFDAWVPSSSPNQGQKWVFAEQGQHGCMGFKVAWVSSTRSDQG